VHPGVSTPLGEVGGAIGRRGGLINESRKLARGGNVSDVSKKKVTLGGGPPSTPGNSSSEEKDRKGGGEVLAVEAGPAAKGDGCHNLEARKGGTTSGDDLEWGQWNQTLTVSWPSRWRRGGCGGKKIRGWPSERRRYRLSKELSEIKKGEGEWENQRGGQGGRRTVVSRSCDSLDLQWRRLRC